MVTLGSGPDSGRISAARDDAAPSARPAAASAPATLVFVISLSPD